ncbi:MAG: NnrS family protein [Thermoanaerobaculales bacterium]|nr:NnrS family protein [Thermoanaerobaculales bacterium]
MLKHVFFQKGFRPFFLLGGIWAVCLVPWWAFTYQQPTSGEPGLESISWHSHEMIFGFTMAIVAGFLLTAVENWTNRPTARGALLAVLVGLWVIGRLVGLGGAAAAIAGLADLLFIPALAVAIAIPLFLAGSKRNYLLLAILPLLWICDLVLHLRTSGLLPQSYLRTDLVAVDLIVVVLVIITGRIVPLFTSNALADESVRPIPALSTAAIVGVIVVALVEVIAPGGVAMAVVAGLAGLLVLGRSVHWGFQKTLGKPVLWILHLGHAWIWFGLFLKAASAAGLPIQSSVATHALTAGAIGTLTLGMMVRVTLGHTGRPLQVSTMLTVAFYAISASAVLRVFGPWLRADLTRPALISSVTLWSLAFALYVIGNLRSLITPRPDGKPG